MLTLKYFKEMSLCGFVLNTDGYVVMIKIFQEFNY